LEESTAAYPGLHGPKAHSEANQRQAPVCTQAKGCPITRPPNPGSQRLRRSARGMLLQLGDEVAADRVALNEVHAADQVPRRVEAEGAVVRDY